ncbi:MAG: hypothetical protein RBU29_00075 [bacterium]|jgi:hypothetical protein|nr:hypothetical protein [bacterium]
MAKKRFLRDGIFDEWIAEVEACLSTIPENDPETLYQFQYINALLVMYKTCKVSLERIEESIEFARRNDPTGEICGPLAEAAMHIQTGVRSTYETLQLNRSMESDDVSLLDFS